MVTRRGRRARLGRRWLTDRSWGPRIWSANAFHGSRIAPATSTIPSPSRDRPAASRHADADPTSTPRPTPSPSPTPAPTATPTATPRPTPTPVPSGTPGVTPTPRADRERWTDQRSDVQPDAGGDARRNGAPHPVLDCDAGRRGRRWHGFLGGRRLRLERARRERATDHPAVRAARRPGAAPGRRARPRQLDRPRRLRVGRPRGHPHRTGPAAPAPHRGPGHRRARLAADRAPQDRRVRGPPSPSRRLTSGAPDDVSAPVMASRYVRDTGAGRGARRIPDPEVKREPPLRWWCQDISSDGGSRWRSLPAA